MKKVIHYKFIIIALLCSFQAFCQDNSITLGEEKTGLASYYHMPGQRTASGEIMQENGFTCAHLYYPFGTMLEVTNLSNNQWIVVKVADRGPFSRQRMLDISYDAAKAIGILGSGTAKVKTMIVGENGQVYISHPAPFNEAIMKEKTVENQDEVPFSSPNQSKKNQSNKHKY